MALIFSKDLSEVNLLNSHNNNIVEFSSDNPLTATDCDLDFGSIIPNITPDPDGLFRYNLKDIVKTLINSSNFKDDYIQDIDSKGYVYSDQNLYKLIPIVYTITFEGGTTETTTKNYLFIKSIKQPDKFSRTIINSVSEKLAFLLPYEDHSVKSYTAIYHKGYPFDFALYSNIARTITIKNKTNNLETTLDINQGVNRIIISDGSQNFTFEDLLPLVTGINNLEFKVDSENFKTLILEKKESSCGTYLRYYSSFGSYFYYLFDGIYREVKKTKIIDILSGDFEDIDSTFETVTITGKGSSNTRSLLVENMTERQRKYLLSIAESPRVDLYTRDQFIIAGDDSWRGVTLNDGSFKVEDKKKNLFKFDGEISFINYTLSL